MKQTLLLFLSVMSLHMAAVAQKRKQVVPPPPVVRDIEVAPLPQKSIYEKLLGTADYTNHAFAFTVDADTLILPNQVFKKQLEIGGNGVRLETASAKDTLRIVKGEATRPLSHYVKYTFYEMKIVKDVATLTQKETAQVLRFKIIPNKSKTKIVKLQNLETKEFYLPATYVGAVPSIGF